MTALTQTREPILADVGAPALANPLVGWLLDEGWNLVEPTDLVGRLAERLVEAGMPLLRMRVVIRAPHPLVFGTRYTWRRDSGQTEVSSPSHDALRTATYLDSPIAAILDGAAPIRRRLDGRHPKLDFPYLEDLVAEGGTDYFALPLPFQDGKINALTLATDRPGGFSDAELEAISGMVPVLARLLEVHTLRGTSRTLIETYLGRHTGGRVLDGLVKRGDGERIYAVIWFCDLRHSTTLAESMAPEAFLAMLNDFFDAMAGAVLDHGGEVLRFIGDAALAIFPIAAASRILEEACTPEEGACERALSAARDARDRVEAVNRRRHEQGEPTIQYGLALHVGDVMYGNIGVPERLEFTVIGAAVNEAARLEGLCKTLDPSILISSAFPRCFPGQMKSLGHHALRGVSAPQEVFTLADGADIAAEACAGQEGSGCGSSTQDEVTS